MKTLSLALTLFLVSVCTYAVPEHFTAHGVLGSFTYTSPNDQIPRTILYYLPHSIENPWESTAPQKTLVFLHGGGESTRTDEASTKVAKLYIGDFYKYSEESKVILIFPTTSIGWNYHTTYFLKNFIPLVKKELAVDPNQLVLAGHSMGGMGITREAPSLTDIFSGFLGLAAGAQEYMQTEEHMLPYFQTNYTHINGEKDAFNVFKTRMQSLREKMTALEEKMGKKAGFQLIFHPGGHNYNLGLTLLELERLFSSGKGFYPKDIYGGYFTTFDRISTDPFNPSMRNVVVDQSFYFQALDYKVASENENFRMNFDVHVRDQEISIETRGPNTMEPKRLKMSLSSELLNLRKRIKVVIDGIQVFSHRIKGTELIVKMPVKKEQKIVNSALD